MASVRLWLVPEKKGATWKCGRSSFIECWWVMMRSSCSPPCVSPADSRFIQVLFFLLLSFFFLWKERERLDVLCPEGRSVWGVCRALSSVGARAFRVKTRSLRNLLHGSALGPSGNYARKCRRGSCPGEKASRTQCPCGCSCCERFRRTSDAVACIFFCYSSSYVSPATWERSACECTSVR